MIMLQKGFPIEVVEVPHAIPEAVKLVMLVAHASRVRLERDISRATYVLELHGDSACWNRLCQPILH